MLLLLIICSNCAIMTLADVKASLKLNKSYLKCEQDILENEEILLEGHVRFFGDFEEYEMQIKIQYLTSSVNYTTYSILFLNHSDASSYFKYTRDGDLNSYRTTLVLNATKDLSESHWRLAGTFKRTDYFSNHVQLPRILDLLKVLIRLNGQTLSKSNTSITIKGDEELTLCCITTLSPCLAVITVNHNQSFSNQTCVSHRPIKGDNSTYMFGYIVCGDDKYSQVFSIDVTIQAMKGEESHGIILCVVFGICLIVLIIFLIFYCQLKRKIEYLVKYFLGRISQANTLPQEDSRLTLIKIPDTNTESTPLSSHQNTPQKENEVILESAMKRTTDDGGRRRVRTRENRKI